VRFGPRIAVDTVLDQIRPILPKGVRLTVSDFKSAVVEAPDSPFVKACASAVEAVTGRTPETLGVPYYSDGAILMEGIHAPFAIVGPGDLGGSGQPDESADIQRIRDASEIYVRIAEDWLGG
ncbi:MAG: M20/M25/M40 family metallo-hydrolase, partial [Pseudomonadota bacterium]